MASASIGTRLGTRIETGSRHNLQCRVDKARFVHGLSYCEQGTTAKSNNPEEELRRNKVKYMMHKDELVLCTSHNLLGTGVYENRHLPYPKVLTTWEGLSLATMTKFVELCNMTTLTEFYDKLRGVDSKLEIPNFIAMGYAMGIAYAHEYNGDTIGTVQIGGLITVLNGAYEMHTGDLVQWYVQNLEEKYFDEQGDRENNGRQVKRVPKNAREQHYMRNTGYTTDLFPNSGKANIFMPKRMPPKSASYMDRQRVFAKCISSAGPYEKVDILICTQSL
jgi:hypothetical protein